MERTTPLFMKLRFLVLLLLNCSSFYSNAQKCSIENEDLVANINLNLSSSDSLYVKVEVDLTNKPEALFIISKGAGCYLVVENDDLHIYLGWDAGSTSNLPLTLGKVVSKGTKAEYLMKVKKNQGLKISMITLHVNYLLYSDYLIDRKKRKKDILVIDKNQIMLADYFTKMKWQNFAFPVIQN